MKWLRPTITRKFLLLLFGFLALQFLQLGIGVYSMLRIGQQSAMIGAINEQRLQTLVLGDLARSSVDPVRTAETRDLLGFGMIRYDEGLLEIEEFLARQPSDSVVTMALIGEARLAWSELLYPLLLQTRGNVTPAARAALLARYDALASAQLERLYRIVSILEAKDRNDASRLAVIQTVVVALSLLLGVIGIFLVRYVVVRPLRSSINVARAIADGAYDRRVETGAYDELGELARTLNRMAAAIGDKTERLHALNEVALVVTSSLSLKEILDQIMLYGMPLSGARGVCISFYDDSTQRFHDWVTRGLPEHYVVSMAFPPGGLADEVVRRGDYLLSDDLPGTLHPLSPLARAEGIRSIICLPLMRGHQCLGVICFYRNDRDTFGFEEIELIKTFSHLAAHAIQNARLHARTVDMAETDVLTGLYNRRKLEQRLREEIVRAQRAHRSVALVLLDLDRFKNINDTHGHLGGDTVLKALATVFTREIRDIDLVARVGGEEFMFVLSETDGEGAMRVAERIRRAVENHVITLPDGTRLRVTASLGIACYPQTAGSTEALMANADWAMYAAKKGGRNRTVLYSG